MYSPCNGNCACATEEKEADACAKDDKAIVLDVHGRCPCGKEPKNCCHSDTILGGNKSQAIGELSAQGMA